MIERIMQFSLENRIAAILTVLAVLVGGYFAYQALPVDAFPDVSPNLVQVFTVTEGLAPEEIEMYVTSPVEAAMSGLPGVEKVRSVSNFGLSVVHIYFKDGMDIYFCRQLVGERLTEAREHIPEGFGEPEMGPISTGMGQVLFYYFEDEHGEHSLEELRAIQDWVVKLHLQTVPGVTEVLGVGGFEKEFQVVVHPEAMHGYRLTLGDIIGSVRGNNSNAGGQFIVRDAEELTVRSVGLASGLEDLRSIVVKTVDGRPVLLGDVADVRTGGAIRRGLQTRNGEEEVVSGMVIKLYGANASTVIEKVEEKIEELNGILPDGVRIVPYYQQKEIVEASVRTVRNALLQGIVLVLIVLFLFMGEVRPSLVAAAAIPFSIAFAFIVMWHLNISANLMTLGGLAIAIGMIVDGTIVMVENADRMIRGAGPGESHLRIFGRACGEVGRPIVFAIAIIIVVFLPLVALQGVEGKTFRPLAYTVSLAMIGSLIFTILVAPALGSLIMRGGRRKPRPEETRENLVVRILLALYRPLLTRFIRHRVVAVTLALLLIGVGAVLFPRLGSEFTPRLNEGTIVLDIAMAPSSSIEESRRMALIVEKRLMKIDEIREVVSRIGRGEVGAHAHPVNMVHTLLMLHPKPEWAAGVSQADIEAKVRAQVSDMPGIRVTLTQPIEMSVNELLEGVRADLAVKLFGEDLDLLKQKADEIESVLHEVPGAADLHVDQITGSPQLMIRPDRAAIARYGINMEDVQSVIRAAVGGEVAGEIFEGIRRFNILVRYREDARNSEDSIRRIQIPAPGGKTVLLEQIADVDVVVGPRQITRENNQRFIAIQCNVVGRDIGTFVEEAREKIENDVELPPGYLMTLGGQFHLQQEANRRMAMVVPATLAILLLLLFYTFRSLRNSMLILLNIPLALVGGVVALSLTGQNLSVPASVGFIALFGVALENGMVLVTHVNRLLRDGLCCDEASLQGACFRLRPVLMTAATTALGLIPLLLSSGTGSEVQRPLATVVVGGLLTSTLLTLFVIPALYKWFAVKPDRVV